MPQRPSISFGEFWRRLGLTGQTDVNPPPQVLPSIQPVLIAGDARSVSPYFDVACGVWSARSNPSGQFFGACLTAPGQGGGVLVKWWSVYNCTGAGAVAGAQMNWAVAPTPAGLSSPSGTIISANPTRPCRATPGTYFQAAGYLVTLSGGFDAPSVLGGDAVSAPQGIPSGPWGEVYVPPGQAFIVETPGGGVHGIAVSAYFFEYPARSPA